MQMYENEKCGEYYVAILYNDIKSGGINKKVARKWNAPK